MTTDKQLIKIIESYGNLTIQICCTFYSSTDFRPKQYRCAVRRPENSQMGMSGLLMDVGVGYTKNECLRSLIENLKWTINYKIKKIDEIKLLKKSD